ncbi:hypothetical protein OG244_19540 [Streptomyces brevispora]|uniref:hypothetical protein n=1 Tax=Streptomyces brevispora TaxID=887462 RepID=UPI002E34DC07|nr:hypothetical protein [Streptomyces brevispora]
MPEPPEGPESEKSTMTIPKLAERVGRSRTLIHRLASTPTEGWPAPVYRPGSTRPEYDVAWFDQYWADRQTAMTQGRRTDLQTPEA